MAAAVAVAPPARTPAPPRPAGRWCTASRPRRTDGWCLPEAQLAIGGIMVAQSIYDTLTRPNAQGEIEPWLAESVEPNEDSTVWTIKIREGVTFHDGSDAHRRGGEEQPRRLPRPVPGAVAAAVRLRARADPERRRHRSADRAGHSEAAVGVVRRHSSTAAAAYRHDGPGPARRHVVVRREPHRHRPVQARRLGAEPEVRGREERGLLGHRRGGQPAPVPRRHRVPPDRRGRPAAERPPVGRDQRHAHERRPDGRPTCGT